MLIEDTFKTKREALEHYEQYFPAGGDLLLQCICAGHWESNSGLGPVVIYREQPNHLSGTA